MGFMLSGVMSDYKESETTTAKTRPFRFANSRETSGCWCRLSGDLLAARGVTKCAHKWLPGVSRHANGASFSKGSPMLRVSVAVVVAVSFAACSHDVAEDEGGVVSVVDVEAEGAVSYGVPADVDSHRVYFGRTAVSVSADAPVFYGHFDVVPRGKVDVVVARADDNRRNVGVKVYRVNPTGTLRFLGQTSGRRSAGVRLETDAGGTFVVEATGSLPGTGVAQLSVDVACARRDGNCARNVQPGGSCGGRRAVPATCDEGLFCQIDADCGRADQPGTCVIPTDICPAVAPRVVCGCDGVDYDDACHAHAVGANVDHDGGCVVEACAYDKVGDEGVNAHGIWTSTFSRDDRDYTAVLGLHDGDFDYTQTSTPRCANPALCRFAPTVVRITGGWENHGADIQLFPDPESTPAPAELALSFSASINCDGDVKLTTTEVGVEHSFSRDLCADFSCNTDDGWVCEVQPVQCVRAPCPPQPTCVLR